MGSIHYEKAYLRAVLPETKLALLHLMMDAKIRAAQEQQTHPKRPRPLWYRLFTRFRHWWFV